MTQSNPYSPPTAPVADASSVEKRVPRTFIALLAIYFLLEIVGSVATGNFLSLARIVVIGIAAWRTIQGGRAASRFLGGLFTLGAVGTLWSVPANWSRSPADAISILVFGILVGSIAAYTFFSPSMRALYVEGDQSRWRAR